MKVFGQGYIVPPLKPAKNGDILFLAKSKRAIIQVRAPASKERFLSDALKNSAPIDLSGELTSFNGTTGLHHILILD